MRDTFLLGSIYAKVFTKLHGYEQILILHFKKSTYKIVLKTLSFRC